MILKSVCPAITPATIHRQPLTALGTSPPTLHLLSKGRHSNLSATSKEVQGRPSRNGTTTEVPTAKTGQNLSDHFFQNPSHTNSTQHAQNSALLPQHPFVQGELTGAFCRVGGVVCHQHERGVRFATQTEQKLNHRITGALV